jgi:hypothetical protein
MTTKSTDQITAEAVDTVLTNSGVSTDELLSAASVLARIVLEETNGQYGALAPWNGGPAFDHRGNAQTHTDEWRQWAKASDFVRDASQVA